VGAAAAAVAVAAAAAVAVVGLEYGQQFVWKVQTMVMVADMIGDRVLWQLAIRVEMFLFVFEQPVVLLRSDHIALRAWLEEGQA
jgi:hypothetical protein